MNELVVPPAPLWYKSSVVACSSDNTLVYGAQKDIVVVRDRAPNEPAEVRIIQGAHSKYITSISLNRRWKEPHSYAVSMGEDGVVKVWDIDTLEKKTSNKDHVDHKQPIIGAVFAGDDRVISAAANGFVVVWNINSNESKPLKDLFKSKVTLTCLSSCPHAGWLLAFGLSNGAVVVADMRRNGQVLYKLRGHYQAVCSLSWCPAPINVYPRHPQNKVKNKSHEQDEKSEVKLDAEASTSDFDKSIVAKEEKVNPWVNLVHADHDEVEPESLSSFATSVQDFLKECHSLKGKILGEDSRSESDDRDNVSEKECNEEETEECQDSENKDSSPEKENKDKERENDSEIKDVSSEKKNRDEERRDNLRPLPTVFDPSVDFLDDLDDLKILHDEEQDEKKDLKEDSQSYDEKDTDEGEKTDLTAEETTPTPVEVVEEEPRAEFLLASSGKDKTVHIWRAGTDGRMQTFFHVGRRGNRRDKNANSWISLCWIAPDTLLTSSTNGDLLSWTIPKPKESNRAYKVVHNEHTSIIFNIVTPPKYSTPYNWCEKTDLTVWTNGQDGRLVCFDINEEKIRLSYSTVTAHVTCFDSSPLDPTRLAIGQKDGNIRVWDLSQSHVKIVTMQKYQQKVTHKVTTISWNPIKEMVLGFGTEEGRVGYIDLASKKSTLFPHFFRSQVFKVEWGPIQGDTNYLGLYCVAEGKMAVYDVKTNESVSLELPENLFVYKFAWKPDFSMLLLNGKDGSLVVLTTDLKAITTLYPSDKGLNGIVWHPDAFTDKTDVTPRCNWFGATTTRGVLVYDCHAIGECNNFTDKIVATFDGHVKPPLSLAWCPFDGDRIVSTASDGLAQVWSVASKSCISTFVDPCLSHNPGVVWSPVDPDLIILGDKIVRIWSVSKNPPQNDEKFLSERKKLVSKTTRPDLDKIKINIPSKSRPKNCIVPALYVSNDENIGQQVENMRRLMVESETSVDPLDIFRSKEKVKQLLDSNYEQQAKEGKQKSCELISLWRGNIGEHIQTAINENRVTPSIITLAPMVSPKLWQDACLAYAKKLSEEADSDPLETSMYFLACHRVENAIDCLCVGSFFKEALALAKQRLPENSEMIAQVTEKWAEHCTNTGNFENAAYCYISVKQFEKAAKVLARRCNKEFLEFAAELAEKEGNKELCDSIKFKITAIENGENSEELVLPRAEENGGGDTVESLEEKMLSRVEAILKENGGGDACVEQKVPSQSTSESEVPHVGDNEEKEV